MEGKEHGLMLACVISGTLFSVLGSASFVILWLVNWRPWRIYSWIFARKWPEFLQGPQLGMLCGFLSLCAWMIVISPVAVLIFWGSWLILILGQDIIGLAVIMAGVALVLAFYSIMLWWRTQWQSSRAVAVLLLLAVGLLCAYELCAVYVTTGVKASEQYSPSGFFFGVSAIALAINMLFICRMVFNGSGLDVDEYVRRAYKYAYSDCIEVGPVAFLTEPPDPNELYPRQSRRASHLGLLYLGSIVVLLVYSILYGLTAKESNWLGAITSSAVIILDWNMGACLYGYQLLRNRVAALFVAGLSRVFLICFGVHYWFIGHCTSYAVVASVLLGAAVSRHLSITNPSAARRDALHGTVIRLREGFRRKDQNSSSSSSEGCGSSVKRSSSADAGHLGTATAPCTGEVTSWNNVEGIHSDKSIDGGRPSLALRSSSCRSVVQETEVGPSYTDKNFDHNSSLVVCSSSGMESQGGESCASTSLNQAMDLNLALAFQEKLTDPQITSMLKRRSRRGELELTSLLQDKGLDPNFAVMLKENGLDPRILALLQRSSLDADRDHRDNANADIIDSNRVDNVMPNQISFSEELRLRGLEKWLRLCRLMLHHIAGTPERAWVLFSFVFSIETTIVAIFRPEAIHLIDVTHQQFEFGIAVLLLSPVVCSIMAFLRSLQSEELSMTSKPRKVFLTLLDRCLTDKAFVGASVGYFSFLFLLAGRALTVLLSPPIVVYSPRVLPVYIYDAHADSGKNVSAAFLMLYGVALATEGWGVVASLKIYPPFAGAAVSAVTLVVAFGFAVSRPCLTLKMVEDAVHFLSKETIIQAIARSATKTRNALSGTYSAPQRSASSAALLVGDPTVARDRAGNFVLPRADVMKLRDRLRNEELTAGSFISRLRSRRILRHEATSDVGHKREMCAHARILALEEAIDTEWVYMWDKFGGYLLLLLSLTAKAERVQDEVRLRLFLDSIGFSDLSAKKIKKWMPEDRRQFELIQESYIREKEIEEEILMQRREEEGRGKERRKALLEKEERKWKEIEASLISSIPNAGSREAAAMAAAVRAVGGDSLLDDSFARERVSSIAYRIRATQLSDRALQTGLAGAVCILDDEPTTSGRRCGQIDPGLCRSQKVSFSISVMIQPESGPVCLLGTEFQKKVCWEILVAGSEQGIEAGQVGLRLITKGDRQTTVAKEWSISSSSIADGRWHIVTMTIDADLGEATCFIDGGYDGYQTGLPLNVGNGIWEQETEVWLGVRPPTDVDAFGRSDSEGAESKMHIMDVFLWGRCLNEDEIAALAAAMGSSDYNTMDVLDDNWQWTSSPPRVEDWESDPADVDLYDRDDVDWDGQYSSGRKRRSDREGVVVDVDSFTRRLRKPRMETQEEINQRMRSVELAVKEALLASGESQFTDQEFPPNDRSLFVDPDNPPSKLQVVSEWMRPIEMVMEKHLDSNPCLFSGTANPSDVCQGRLGDCWFLSAVAVLTEVSRISEVIITPQYNEEGIYTVRFCIQGEWVPVVVDDWIPCESPGKPAFATSRKRNELWVSVLEKAYAKLHGSYEALEGGLVQDALVDLTGGAGEEIDIRSAQAQIDLASGRLWSQLLRFKQEGFLLGAGSPSGSDVHVSSSGIVQGHAYSILQVREVDGNKLVQIRNPWANEVEWNGPWSDSSPEWTDRMKHKLKHVPQAKDGIFWMSWQDFQIHFRSIYVCRVYPPEMHYSVHSQWRGYSAGGCQDYDTWHQNPQFRLRAMGPDASLPIHVFITLTQGVSFSRTTAGFKNFQSSHDSQMFYIGMRILKTRGHRAAYNIYMHESVGGTDYVNSREISCEMVLDPDPKGYTIVPTTIHPGEEAPFVLSVFTKASIALEAL
ncbi:calpain-type cysteine protease DEK1-like [Olea europaea var. sylvestris]|uniref:calpain-type cysteine protease DEK1-like n=1 Tax=Olea europaea var. sylvestris TaxID=158386 RepID=UPI000C1CE59F|nr:calpain-type cysteine protease DEK1-like [Olea europaea var. sylvestris]